MAWPFPRLITRTIGRLWTRGFDAGRPDGRHWSDAGFGRIVDETAAAALPVRSRARQFYANDPHLSAGVGAWTTNLVGAGLRPTPQHPSADSRKALVALYDGWTPHADPAGIFDFTALQSTMARALVVVGGEGFARILHTPDGLRVQLVPAELVSDETRDGLPNGGNIVSGVEFDHYGRRVAYHVYPDARAVSPIRIPAGEMLHIFRPLLPGQVRGISWLAPILLRANELDQLADALLVGVKVAAMFSAFATDENATGGSPFAEGDVTGSLLTASMEPGSLRVLPSGWRVNFASPQQAQETAAFVRHQLRALAVGLGVPAHLMSGDLSDANFGSLRADLIHFNQRVEAVQHAIIVPALLQPVWRHLVTCAVLSGDLRADDFEADPAPWLACEWLAPKGLWLDPLKDAQAEAAAIAAGLKSRRQAVGERGYSVEALDAEIAADRVRETELGLQFGEPPAAQPKDSAP